eukprot:GHVO01036556.1.p1 GENE.GHVO01036556.1~~GHVO01036556.1.p1  ORF type:complete len:207 (+),score=11.68 GHVO01036556.1:68-688(+)
MFAKLCVLAAAAQLALGITLDAPTNVTSGLVSDVTWTSNDGDPTFTLELNHPSFSNSFALANNVNPTSGSPLSIEWPIVPADSQYSLSAVNISNINQVYSTSAQFTIAQAPTTLASTSSLGSTTFTTGSGSTTKAATSTSVSTTGSAIGSTASSGSSTSSSSSSTTSSGSFNGNGSGSGNGAASFKSGSTGILVVLAAVAGATLFL